MYKARSAMAAALAAAAIIAVINAANWPRFVA
jgi:hypothetical protein